MIVASEEVVITFEGKTVTMAKDKRTARVNLYLAKADEHGAVRYAVDVEEDCTRRMEREVRSTAYRPDGTSPTIKADPGDHAFKPVEKESFPRVILEHLCGITQLEAPKGGIYLTAPGTTVAHGVFALLALGIENEPAAQLASKLYDDPETLKSALDEQKVKAEQRPAVIKALDAQIAPEAKPPPPIVSLASAVASGHVGRYMHSEMELASGLWLKADGTFEYFLTVGSLDEAAKGRWTAAGNRITLINDPVPVPPTITQGEARLDAAGGFRVKVALPSGRGVQGVDVLVGFDRGEPASDYTQTDGWALAKDEKREPRWVQLSMSSYGLTSPRFPIDAKKANLISYTLMPNDIGVVDLRNAPITVKGDMLSLGRQGQTMLFKRRSGQTDEQEK
ncbi:hypothetical protein FSB78_10630 [Sphingomonas ginsenosidivorax]|uniref:Uncharacterized protein n=1 Tax=Sphingomonas ginsenosidivorax TaxID=862135 RepID=A0A5C6UH08_9SPHN|nr:hypothetical protein [Sphingomonas ginsenosidivorax]TXC71345.1 hypothetical protein FSB78_10630 [Sphingomonas ginsenosidivorax]